LKETLLKLRAAPSGFHRRNPIPRSIRSKGRDISHLPIIPFIRTWREPRIADHVWSVRELLEP
jgi:hypothetical protein